MEYGTNARKGYTAPAVECTEVRIESGIAQSLPAAGDYGEGGDLQPWE